jgi:hypothetical protein
MKFNRNVQLKKIYIFSNFSGERVKQILELIINDLTLKQKEIIINALIEMFYPLIEYELEFELPEEVRNHEHMHNFLTNIIECSIAITDIFSIKF